MINNSDGTIEPDVAHMGNNNYRYKKYSPNETVTLLKEHYTEVMHRDSVSMQLNNYKESKYTAFRTKEEPNVFRVISRTRWNAVEECILRYLVHGQGIAWPDEITINFGEQKTIINGTTVNFKSKDVVNISVKDKQNTDYTCGPTSCSACTQVLHNYYSEQYLQRLIGATCGSGSAPSAHVRALNKLNFKAELYSSRDTLISHLRSGRPAVIHVHNHYICAASISPDESKILMINSTENGGYSPATGWADTSTVEKRRGGRSAVRVSLNWTITDTDKAKFNHFYNSMGGAWNKPYVHEKICNANKGVNVFL